MTARLVMLVTSLLLSYRALRLAHHRPNRKLVSLQPYSSCHDIVAAHKGVGSRFTPLLSSCLDVEVGHGDEAWNPDPIPWRSTRSTTRSHTGSFASRCGEAPSVSFGFAADSPASASWTKQQRPGADESRPHSSLSANNALPRDIEPSEKGNAVSVPLVGVRITATGQPAQSIPSHLVTCKSPSGGTLLSERWLILNRARPVPRGSPGCRSHRKCQAPVGQRRFRPSSARSSSGGWRWGRCPFRDQDDPGSPVANPL